MNKAVLVEAKRMEMMELVNGLLGKTPLTRRDLAKVLRVRVGSVGRYKCGQSMGTNAQRATLRGLCAKHGLDVPALGYLIGIARFEWDGKAVA